jgi:fumarate hydratase class I
MAPLTMWDEKNTGSNLPAQIEIYATDGDAYKFLFMAKGGGSANKSYLYQETKAVLNPARMASFLEEKIRTIGTSACPPYHLAIVVGGTSAEFALKTAKYASARYLDTLPTSMSGLDAGHSRPPKGSLVRPTKGHFPFCRCASTVATKLAPS